MAGKKTALDKDLKQISRIEKAAMLQGQSMMPIGAAALFLVAVFVFVSAMNGGVQDHLLVIFAAMIGGYMALNIGANDVANNVGPAVGSRALTLVGALIVAAIFETAGALIAGGEVVSTISKGIIDASQISDPNVFLYAMFSALLAAALWLNLATALSAPVSTTHSIVGGVLGGGVAAAGVSVVNWPVMGKIAASWVISPVMGGLIAAGIYYLVRHLIYARDDKIAAAKTFVPVLIGLMTAAFSTFILIKGLKRVYKMPIDQALIIFVLLVIAVPFLVRPFIRKAAEGLPNENRSVQSLFRLPLICGAALLSFAHGSNDVANAVGPLAAIVAIADTGEIAGKVGVPLWIMGIGAFGISFGLLLFGPKLIKLVGQKITRLDQARAFCVALSAAITVIIASLLGLPVSSTHTAVGGVFGVGLYREFSANRKMKFAVANGMKGKERKRILVRRNHLTTIAAAWVITVPCSAFLSALIFLLMQLAFNPA